MSNNTSKEPETLLFDEFQRRICKEIFDHLPSDYKDAHAETFMMRRLNDSYNAMQVLREGDELRGIPVINLDALYEAYSDGMAWDDIIKNTADIALTTSNVNFDRFGDYQYARTRLIIRVSNWLRNEDLKDELPYMKFGDIMLTCHLMLEDTDCGVTSARISHSMMMDYGIDAETLFSDAMESCPRLLPPVLMPVESILKNPGSYNHLRKVLPFPEAVQQIDFTRNSLYVLTNSINVGGAAAMFYPDILSMIADKAKSDLYILPSSVHEVLIVQAKEDLSPSFCRELVMSVNKEKMMTGIKLADSVFGYDRKNKTLTDI